MLPLVIPYPNIDPVAIKLGWLSIKWYGLAYAAGLIFGLWYVRKLLGTPYLWTAGKAPLAPYKADDLLLYTTIGVIGGGRLGQVLLYDPKHYLAHPLDVFAVWNGGMSFHGALVFSALAHWLFARRNGVKVETVWDLCSAAVPVGIFLGRIANFINSEHWGRPTDVAWAMVFPNGGDVARHPSQLYEAALEGLLMFLLLRYMTHRVLALKRPGLVTGTFVFAYGCARIFCEMFREPEPVHALNIGWLTAGQIYSAGMLLVGAILIWRARNAGEAAAVEKARA